MLDGRVESGDFGLEWAVTSGGPETEQKGGLGLDGSGDGLGWFVGRASTLLEDC